MFSIRHIAVASVAGVVLSFGVIGCAPAERPDVIPSSAQMMDSGNGMVHYTAPRDGTVYVYDHAADRLLWSGKVRQGQSVDLDPVKNQIVVGSNVVANKLLNANDRSDVYFDPAPQPVTAPQQQSINPPPAYNNGLTVTPQVTVQPNNGTAPSGSVTVQPGLHVTPSPTQPPTPTPTPAPTPAPQQPNQ